MKERPVLFNAEMVNAILSGRKTQTRRVMKVQPEIIPPEDECGNPGYWIPFSAARSMVRNEEMHIACPYGLKRDRLWVRETFSGDFEVEGMKPSDWSSFTPVWYWADGNPPYGDWTRPKPSLHMPRKFCRLLLEITSVRVERLNDISESDARAEGIIDGGCLNCGEPEPCGCASPNPDATDAFAYLWQSIYGVESWFSNPWVWVIEFKRVEAPE